MQRRHAGFSLIGRQSKILCCQWRGPKWALFSVKYKRLFVACSHGIAVGVVRIKYVHGMFRKMLFLSRKNISKIITYTKNKIRRSKKISIKYKKLRTFLKFFLVISTMSVLAF